MACCVKIGSKVPNKHLSLICYKDITIFQCSGSQVRLGLAKNCQICFQSSKMISFFCKHVYQVGNFSKEYNILLIVLIELSPTQHVGQFLHEINLFYGQLRPMKIVLTFGSKRLQRSVISVLKHLRFPKLYFVAP